RRFALGRRDDDLLDRFVLRDGGVHQARRPFGDAKDDRGGHGQPEAAASQRDDPCETSTAHNYPPPVVGARIAPAATIIVKPLWTSPGFPAGMAVLRSFT